MDITGYYTIPAQGRRQPSMFRRVLLVGLVVVVLYSTVSLTAIWWTPLQTTKDNLSSFLEPSGGDIIKRGSDNQDDIETTSTTQGNSSRNNPHPHARIAYVTFSYLNVTDLDRWTKVIFPATELFIPATDPYYVVMTLAMQDMYHNLTRTHEDFIKYQHRIQPIFVDCPEGKFGHSPCCKQEVGLLEFYHRYYYDYYDQFSMKHFILNATTKLTKRWRSSRHQTNYDWILFQDDDMYIRHHELQFFVHDLPLDEEPIVLTSYAPPGTYLGQEGYLKNSSYHCSRLDNWTYPWGQPAVYNRAAFEQIVTIVFQRGGLVKQCLEYQVTHDVGNALLHWMMMFPTLWIRITANQEFRDDYLAYHRVGRDGPGSMIHQVHEQFDHLRYPFNISTPVPRFWTNTTGFRLTQTFQHFGHPSNWTEWHTMPTSDCLLNSTPKGSQQPE